MPITRTGTAPNLSFDGGAVDQRIPIMFASDAQQKFNEMSTVREITNSDFIGEIKNAGDAVIIPTIGNVTINDYSINKKIVFETQQSPSVKFTVNKSKDWNTALDRVLQSQMQGKDWIQKYATQAGIDMEVAIDREFFSTIFVDAGATNKGAGAGKRSGNINLGTVAAPVVLTDTNVERFTVINIADALAENSRGPNQYPGECFLVLPPRATSLFKLAPIVGRADASGDGMAKIIKGGYIRTLNGINIYESNQLFREANGAYHCIFGHKSGITYAGQFTQTEMVRPAEYFLDAMKGVYVYDYKVMIADSVGDLIVMV